MFQVARKNFDQVWCIVNNDHQQVLKKGKIIIPLWQRSEIIRSLRCVDRVIISMDGDLSVCKTLEETARIYKNFKLYFGNGGDRRNVEDIPETEICKKYNIELVFGLADKITSSSEILKRILE
jgi:glycerol-3-phosphate cytidylyltransferase-like family protein